jgi:hypothetical protein
MARAVLWRLPFAGHARATTQAAARQAAKDAVKYLKETGEGAGLPTVAELCGHKGVRAIAGWLDYQEQHWTPQGYKGSGAAEEARPATRTAGATGGTEPTALA